MRARLVIASLLIIALPALAGPLVAPVHAQSLRVAQDEGNDEAPKQKPAQPSEPAPSPTEEEAGPPWTYQMARISLILLAFMILGAGVSYYRLVIKRQRGEN